VYAFFQRPKNPTDFEAIRIKLASPEKIGMVLRRGEEAGGDHQLPYLQAGAGRALLREDFWPVKDWSVSVESKKDEAQGGCLR